MLSHPGILEAAPLIDLANKPIIKPLIQAKDILGIAIELTEANVTAVKTMPCISANGQISTGDDSTAEDKGWRNAAALVLALVHHMTNEQFKELKFGKQAVPAACSW